MIHDVRGANYIDDAFDEDNKHIGRYGNGERLACEICNIKKAALPDARGFQIVSYGLDQDKLD